MKNRIRHYLKGVTSPTARRRIYELCREKFGEPIPHMNPSRRHILAKCIFEVENDFESRGDGRPDHPTVVQLRAARNLVYDDLGINEYPKSKKTA